MISNHVADIVARYSDNGAAVPAALTDYIEQREGYDYDEHGRAGNAHTAFVPDEVIDRFCLIGPPASTSSGSTSSAGLGVNQFALYLHATTRTARCALQRGGHPGGNTEAAKR